MSARFLLRLDDACPTMDRRRWDRIEAILDRHQIKPIVAVIPSNLDPTFFIDPPDGHFWHRVRSWQRKGWTVGMHGLHHLLHPTRAKQLLPFYPESEFSGLSLPAQKDKLRRAWEIFLSEGVRPQVFVAPAHTFDLLTLRALRAETEIQVISDGIAADLYYQHKFFWIPQQLWRLKPLRFGLWTVCLHPNTMDKKTLKRFDRDVQSFRDQIMEFSQLTLARRRRNLLDRAVHFRFWIGKRGLRAALGWW